MLLIPVSLTLVGVGEGKKVSQQYRGCARPMGGRWDVVGLEVFLGETRPTVPSKKTQPTLREPLMKH